MPQSTMLRVVDCISQTTRYPVKLLQPTADLEIDLGIDSVKRVEIVVALGKEFGLALADQPRDKSIRTIADIATWVEKMQGDGAATSPAQSTPSQVTPPPVAPQPPAQAPGTPVIGYHTPPAQQFTAPTPTPQPTQPTPSQFNGHSNGNGHGYNHEFNDNGQAFRYDNVHASGMQRNTTQMQSTGNHRPLAGKIAFVTGSGRGVGKVIARVLSARGATVIVNSFHSRDAGEATAAEINQSGGQAIHLWGSVANPDQVNAMFAEIESRFGRLDILVCNASDGKIGSFMELTPEDWDRAFRTNVSGHHQCATLASKLMQRAGGGAIVTMSAVGSHRFIHGLGSQGIVKAAVETQTRYLACELGKFGIRVNCVVGGPVYGDLLSKFPDAQATQNHWETVCPDGNLTSPIDLANTIGFLVSDDAHGINGAIWAVDHGFSAMSSGQPIPKPLPVTRTAQVSQW